MSIRWLDVGDRASFVFLVATELARRPIDILDPESPRWIHFVVEQSLYWNASAGPAGNVKGRIAVVSSLALLLDAPPWGDEAKAIAEAFDVPTIWSPELRRLIDSVRSDLRVARPWKSLDSIPTNPPSSTAENLVKRILR